MSDAPRTLTPRILPFRPLNGGMRRDIAPTEISPAECYTAANFMVGTKGPQRAHAPVAEFGGNAVPYPPVYGYEILYKTDGTQLIVMWDTKFMYTATTSALTPKYWTYSVGTAKTSGALLVASATANFTGATAWVRSGDTVSVGAGASLEVLGLSAVTSSEILTLGSVPTLPHAAGSAYQVRRAFNTAAPFFVDVTTVSSKLVFADSVHPMMSFDGTTFGIYDDDLQWVPSAVGFFGDRLYAGRIISGGVDYRQRLMWSKALDRTDFGTFGIEHFVDRPYAPGALRRIVPLGAFLALYFEDSIDIGRTYTGASDRLPLAFERLQTGGIGIVGMKAVRPWLDGHFFVGQDNIYYLGIQGGFEKIGTPVIRETINACEHPYAIWVMPDIKNDRVVFGFPESTATMAKLWSFDYKAKAWSYEERSATALGDIQKTGTTYDELGTYSASINGLGAVFPTIASLSGSSYSRTFVYGTPGGYTFRLDGGSASSSGTTYETGDIDLGDPDRVKSAYRLSFKIDRVLSSDLVYTVGGSTDEGINWRTLGTITIPTGKDEGFCNFQLTGSTLRFRLTSSSNVPAYIILEATVKVKGRGVESFFGGTD